MSDSGKQPPAAARPAGQSIRPSSPSIPAKPRPVNQEAIDEIAELAMVLREEQVQARIVHYKAEMETNAELDAITAQVVEQLKMLQQQVASSKPKESREKILDEQVRTLTQLLSRIFKPDGTSVLVEQRLRDAAKKITRLFFESETHERISGGPQTKTKTMHHAEQALFYVLQRYQNRLRADLESFDYADPEIKEMTIDLLDKTQNDFRMAFLSRRSPELKRVLAVINEVLFDFFRNKLPPDLPTIARDVIHECGSATSDASMGYKVLHGAFPAFRQAFERRLIARLVGHVQKKIVERLEKDEERFRDETVAFVQMPQIYSEICSLVADAVYDFLCNEGFLDLPIDWRAQMQGASSSQ